jgi:tetratricopeptide (TPR) repeat protein
MRRLAVLALFAVAAQPLAAKPLVTSSEETLARLCLARDTAPERIVEACDAALFDAGLTQAQRVDLLVARGDGQFWLDDFSGAEESYREALAKNPRSVEAWNGLGWTFWETEGDEAAYEAFSASLAVDVSVQGLGGTAAAGRRSGVVATDEARRMLEAALAIDPDYVWAMREIGWTLLEDGRTEEAVRRFEAALASDPADINALYGLGRARLAAGEPETALDYFNRMLAEAPDDLSGRIYRITALRRLDRNAQALREADRLIADHPDKATGYVERGRALAALERRAEAIETFRAAEEALGANNALLYWHADLLATDERFAEALDVIERGIGLAGADYSDHLLKSYIAIELGNYALARAAAEASLATGVEDPWAHYYIAVSMVRSGDVPEGLARFDRAIAAGLPADRIGAFARELIGSGKYVEAAQLRLKY